ncbi:MAG TPA: PAS domain-containing sensor histidine kinase [Candidatus Dormibacteraeota bacterium]|nr:PAS domain-containing sensor histidine kinase [Candidatus Dormibacteraeota bacterium]
MRSFSIAAVVAVAVLVATTAYILASRADSSTDLVLDGGQAFTAVGALVTCGWLAHRSSGRVRLAWVAIALSAGIAVLVEIGEAAVILATGHGPRFLVGADFGIAAAVPAAIAGLLLFPAEDHPYANPRRTALDVAMIALSLIFVASALSLPQLFIRIASPTESWIGVASLALDFALLTVVSFVLRRSPTTLRSRLLFMLGGFALMAAADCGAVLVAATGQLDALRELLSAGPMYGFILVTLAPLWPEHRSAGADDDMPLWPDLIPYAGCAAVAFTAIVISVEGQPMTIYAAAAAGGIAATLLGSHLLSRSEARELLRASLQTAAKLREQKSVLDNLIDHAPQGVASIGPDRRIKNANPRLASMLGASTAILAGASTDDFLPADYVARVFRSFASGGDNTTDVYESDCQARRADKGQFWVHWSIAPIRKADGSIDYFIATFEDVTAKRESDELSAANLAQLEKLNLLKSEFVSMVSHEFRTALVGIQGFSELIRDQDIEASEMKVLADEIYNDSQRLNRMITEMLDFDRLEAGKLQLQLRPLDINRLVRDAVEHAAVTTKKHVISTSLESDLPDVVGDADRLTQVMTNLLSNAIKYSPNGGDICVTSRLDGGMVEVAVRDNGRGIPHEFVSRLFGKYERYEDHHAGKIIGTGLGLAITRQIVEMHGGRITVESVVGQGSEFRFTVPVTATVSAFTRSA